MDANENEAVDLYTPRKCSASNALIGSKDFGSIQFNIARLDDDGVYRGTHDTFALCSQVRRRGESDFEIMRFATTLGYFDENPSKA